MSICISGANCSKLSELKSKEKKLSCLVTKDTDWSYNMNGDIIVFEIQKCADCMLAYLLCGRYLMLAEAKTTIRLGNNKSIFLIDYSDFVTL